MKSAGSAFRRACIIAGGTIVITASACQPSGPLPGVSLSGQVAPFPADWAFSNQHREIAIQVSTPYWIPHSVTIWCAEIDGRLFVAAASPEEKRWPGWVADDPNVRLGVGDMIYEARLEQVTDPSGLEQVSEAYRVKYELPERSAEDEPLRFWSVLPRTE